MAVYIILVIKSLSCNRFENRPKQRRILILYKIENCDKISLSARFTYCVFPSVECLLQANCFKLIGDVDANSVNALLWSSLAILITLYKRFLLYAVA